MKVKRCPSKEVGEGGRKGGYKIEGGMKRKEVMRSKGRGWLLRMKKRRGRNEWNDEKKQEMTEKEEANNDRKQIMKGKGGKSMTVNTQTSSISTFSPSLSFSLRASPSKCSTPYN
jgi:hypothetical protein